MTDLRTDLIRRKEEELEGLRAQSRADNRCEAFGVLRRVERVARYKGSLAEAIGYLNDDDAELLAEFCATVIRITERDGEDGDAAAYRVGTITARDAEAAEGLRKLIGHTRSLPDDPRDYPGVRA